jgi:hypothetical protein
MKDDPAFPVPDMPDHEGMYLRDYFAAKAMAIYYSSPDAYEHSEHVESLAEWCYGVADAMLDEREK